MGRGRSVVALGYQSSMPHLIAWCAFVGAWLLVVGPLDQATRELQEEEFERDAVALAASAIEAPPAISRRWIPLVPVYYVLRQRRAREYRRRILAVMDSGDLEAFAHLREVATAWAYVAAGASLIAVKETWVLHESYEWAGWTFWALLVLMLALGAAVTAAGVRRRRGLTPSAM